RRAAAIAAPAPRAAPVTTAILPASRIVSPPSPAARGARSESRVHLAWLARIGPTLPERLRLLDRYWGTSACPYCNSAASTHTNQRAKARSSISPTRLRFGRDTCAPIMKHLSATRAPAHRLPAAPPENRGRSRGRPAARALHTMFDIHWWPSKRAAAMPDGGARAPPHPLTDRVAAAARREQCDRRCTQTPTGCPVQTPARYAGPPCRRPCHSCEHR